VSNEPVSILVPGRGLVNASALAVDKAVNEYDERLRFGFNETNQDWFIYILMERDFPAFYYVDGSPVYPIRGFGKEIPTPETAVNAIRQMDTWQNNFDLAVMNFENERQRKRLEMDTNERIEEAAMRSYHALKRGGYVA
jgi:hypothetical protein